MTAGFFSLSWFPLHSKTNVFNPLEAMNLSYVKDGSHCLTYSLVRVPLVAFLGVAITVFENRLDK